MKIMNRRTVAATALAVLLTVAAPGTVAALGMA